MSKLGRGRRTKEERESAQVARAARGDEVREAWNALEKIADEMSVSETKQK